MVHAPDPERDRVHDVVEQVEPVEVAADHLDVGRLESLAPVVTEVRAGLRNDEVLGWVDPGHRVGGHVVADERRQQLPVGVGEAEGERVDRGRVLVGPDAVLALVAVHRRERHERLRAEAAHLGEDPDARGDLAGHAWRDAMTVRVEVVDHVGIAEPGERQQDGACAPACLAASGRSPAAVVAVVGVDDEDSVHVDEQDRVLVRIRERHHPDARAEWHPLPIGEDLDPVAVAGQEVPDPGADVVGQQDRPVGEGLERRQVQVVGMAVRDPQVRARPDRCELLVGHLVGEDPAPEVRGAGQPRVRGEERGAVVHDQRGVADRLEREIVRRICHLLARPRSASRRE